MQRIFFFLILLIGSRVCWASPAPLLVGIPEYPPNSFVTETDIGGFDVDIIKKMAAELQLPVEFVPCSWVRCVELFKTGKVDMLGSFNHSVEREQFSVYLGPSYTPGQVIFIVLKENGPRIRNYGDLNGLNVGHEASAKLFARFDNDKQLNKYPSSSIDTLLALLASGRLDAIAYSDTTAYLTLRQPENRNKFDVAEFKSGNVGYFAMSKQSQYLDLAKKIDAKIHQLMNNGFIRQAIQKYQSNDQVVQSEH